MLLTRGQLTRHRWFFWSGLLVLVVAFVAAMKEASPQTWSPNGGTGTGLLLGILAAAIIAFEMLLWPRKRLRWQWGNRLISARTWKLGPTKRWMQWHLWLGLISLPIALMHSGYLFWNDWFSLPWCLTVAMALVYFSGIYGLWLQNWIPRQLLQQVTAEVPAAEIKGVMQHHRHEFSRRLELELQTCTGTELQAAQKVAQYFQTVAELYLTEGNSRSPLATDARAMNEFAKIRTDFSRLITSTSSRSERLLNDLEELCGLRRQLDVQRRLQRRLHLWLLVHFPLSVWLCFLLVAHVLTALKYL